MLFFFFLTFCFHLVQGSAPLGNHWFGVLSKHLDVTSFVLLYSNERAYYLEHQDFCLAPCGNWVKALTPFEQSLNKCSFLLVCLFLVRFIHPLTLVRILSFVFYHSCTYTACLCCCPSAFPLGLDTWALSCCCRCFSAIPAVA